MSNSYNTLKYDVADRILTLTLNRPENLNAFTVEMAEELVDAFNRASDDDEVGAIVVTGSGKAFCAGMDLSVGGNVFGLDENLSPTLEDMNDRADEPAISNGVRDTGGKVTLAIYECKKPVIAAINGAAVGVGATMTCAMDIRLASDKARIGFVFNKIAITPEACSTWFLPRIVGISQALEWCYTGEIFDGETAKDAGLVKAVIAQENLLDEAYKIAHLIVEKSQISIALTRQMLYRNSALDHPYEAHKVDSLSMFYTSINDGKEGVSAFLDKRKPEYSTRASTDMPDFYPWW